MLGYDDSTNSEDKGDDDEVKGHPDDPMARLEWQRKLGRMQNARESVDIWYKLHKVGLDKSNTHIAVISSPFTWCFHYDDFASSAHDCLFITCMSTLKVFLRIAVHYAYWLFKQLFSIEHWNINNCSSFRESTTTADSAGTPRSHLDMFSFMT